MIKPQLTLEDLKRAFSAGANFVADNFLFDDDKISPAAEDYIKNFSGDVHAPGGLDVLQIITNYSEYTSQLEPCPFCTYDVIRILPQEFGFSIHCDRCGAKKEYHGKEIDGAVHEWNNRRSVNF